MSQQTLTNSRVDYSLTTTPPGHLDPNERTNQLEGIEIIPYQRELDRELEYEVKALGWVVDNSAEQYLEANLDREVAVPNTYSELNSHDWDPYVARVDGRVHRYGWGVNRKLIEAALRVMTGGGRFDAKKYTLYGCGVKPFVLTGPEGTLIGSVRLVGKPSNEKLIPNREIDIRGTTVTVSEDSMAILEGVKRAVPLIEEFEGKSLTFSTRSPGWWWFTDGSGRSVRMSNDDLATLGRSQPCAANIPVFGGGVLLPTKSWRGSLGRYDWTPEGEVGEPHEHGGVYAGFEIEWERRRLDDGTTHTPAIASLILHYRESDHMADEISLFKHSDRLED